MQAIKSNVGIFILFQISEIDIDLQEEEVSANVENEAKAGNVTIDNVMELECNVTDVNVEEMARDDDDTNTLREDVLLETEDENNINVREVLELEDEIAANHMNMKRKDVFEETAEVVTVMTIMKWMSDSSENSYII